MPLKKVHVKNAPVRMEWVEAGSLTDNPHNWRRHPKGQTNALKDVLGDVGWAGVLLYNETTGRLIDGHARKDAVPPKTAVPVMIGHWTEEQELKILATLDPLGAMAETDADALESLLAEVDLEGEGMDDLEGYLDTLIESSASEYDPSDAKTTSSKNRKRGPSVMEFALGGFHFEIGRQEYDAWLTRIEEKTGGDPDRVIREIKRRLKLVVGSQ
jgi:hypothetical protein